MKEPPQNPGRFTPVLIEGNKFKKKIFLPIYAPLAMCNMAWLWVMARKNPQYPAFPLMMSLKLMLSRSLIAVWQK